MGDNTNTVVFEFTTAGTTLVTDDVNKIADAVKNIKLETAKANDTLTGVNNSAALFTKSEEKILNDGAKLAKTVSSAVIQGYKDETKALEDKFTKEKALIENAAKAQIDSLNQTTNLTISSTDLSERQKNIIKAKASAEAAAINAKAKADELAAQADMDAQKKKLAQKAADISFAITAAQIISSTASAVMKDFADPTLLPPFDAIAAVITAGIGVVQLEAANEQRKNVQALGAGGIVQGPKHSQGGVRFNIGGNTTELEGGEGVIRTSAMAIPGVANLVETLNNHTSTANIDKMKIQPTAILSKSVIIDKNRENTPTKVYVLEKEITRTQQKVAGIQNRAVIG